jgi:hypothetical protein
VVAAASCAGTGHDSLLRDSLESGKTPLAEHLDGPVSVLDEKLQTVTSVCGDDAIAQVSGWEHEARDDGLVCKLDDRRQLILCVGIETVNQTEIALVFDDATSRLVGVMRSPMGIPPQTVAWYASLHNVEPACK